MTPLHETAAAAPYPPADGSPAAGDPLDSMLCRLGEEILAEPLPEALLALLRPEPSGTTGG